jgi:hypothetical protein
MIKSINTKSGRRALVSLALTAAATVSGFAVAAGPAGASSSSVMTATWTPQESPSVQGPYYWPVVDGTSVTMHCWTTGPSKLGTAKWFYIASNAYPFTTGYVPANAVGRQSIVGHC